MAKQPAWLAVSCPRCGAVAGAACQWSYGTNPHASHRQRINRTHEEADFWAWVDDRLADPACSMTEQELLDSIALPGWTGRKARLKPAQRVFAMPVRDRKMAAAGDRDDAA